MPNLEQLDKTIRELEQHSNDLKGFNEVNEEISKLKEDISDNLKQIKENNQLLSNISEEIEKRLNETQKKIDEIYKDNKDFQKELDGSLRNRLEKHKSDLQLEIRNEANQTTKSIENTLISNFNNLESKIKETFEKHEKQLKVIKVMNFVILLFILGLAVGMYLKI